MWAKRQCGNLLLLVSCAVAQSASPNAVNVERLRVVPDRANVRVEITLSAAPGASATVTAVKNPNRLVLDLPNTLSAARQQQVAVNYKGVHAVRLGLNSSHPPVTRVVVDLDPMRPYTLQAEGNRIVLVVGTTSAAIVSGGQGAAAAGAPGGLVGIFRRSPPPPVEMSTNPEQSVPPPPPPGTPIKFPEDQGRDAANSTATSTSSRPTAAHPNLGSLQQGTVFPSLGSPGTGNVPTNQSASVSAAGSSPVQAPAASPASGVTTPPGAVFPPRTAADSGVPSAVVTPAPPSTQNPSPVGPSSVTQHPPSKSGTESAGNPSVPATAGDQVPASVPVVAVPPQSSKETVSVGNSSGPSTMAAAPPSESGDVSARNPSAPATLSDQEPATAIPAQQKPEPIAVAPGQQSEAPAKATSLPQQADAQKTTAGQPIDQAVSAPADKTSQSEVPAKAPAVGESPAVVAAEPAPVAPATVPDNTTSSPETGAGKGPADADLPLLALRAVDPNLRTVFKVKYVAEGVAYLDGGRSSGLTEGMKLEIMETDLAVQQGSTGDPNDPRAVAELEVTAVAETSAVTDIHLPKRQVKPGDLAYLSSGDAQALVQQRSLSATRKYPAVVTFTEGDPLEEEARAEVPRPPQPSVNRARGRVGFDYMGTVSRGDSSVTSSNIGMIVRADITRIGGTYWNMSGYWRGRLSSLSSTSQQTLQDLINRTYHLSVTYDNPNSPWVAGFGRLYLPWASSLDTIDGGYFGRRVVPGVTAGIFAGSTPDPTSWNYNPDRRIGGAFVNFQGGSFDAFHYTSTAGLGISTLKWKIDRPFAFFENTLSYKRYLSIYHSLQADSPAGNPAVPAPGPGISRSFLTFRIQPHPRLELDFNHNYFRDVPTFDPQLIGTGLLDKYLFQGFSAGARVEVVKQIFVYGSLGQSNRSGDAKASLNQMYGVTFNQLPWLGLRADAHYSKFDSSFGSGSYRALSLSKNLGEEIRLEVLGGDQTFSSLLTTNNRSRFINTNLDFAIGAHYFMQGGFTVDRGQLSYDQWMFTIGYRFDSKGKHR